MATTSPAKEPTETPAKPPPPISQSPVTPLPVKPETPTTTTTTTTTTTSAPRPPDPPPSDADVIHVPSYSRWFSWSKIHDCEVRFVPEFFDTASHSKNPGLYMYYRNSIVKQFRANPSKKLTFTDARKILVGDVGSIRRVFDFLEAWGLVNYSPSAHNKPLKWEDKESKSDAKGGGGGAAATVESSAAAASNRESSNKVVCSGCKLVCSIACFACDKYDLTLCARCYVRGNYRVGVNSGDFRRVEISEDMKADWTEKETLYLLEAIMHYGDDWKRVAQLVGGRSEKECVAQFIKLPFGEQYLKYPESGEVDNNCNAVKDQVDAGCGLESSGASFPSKRMRLTPLADASNPIMAQAAFLSTLAGVDIAEAAARAAVLSLSQVGHGANREHLGTLARNTKLQEADVASNGDTTQNALDGAFVEANSQIQKEQLDVERAISEITQQMKAIQNKLVRFEDLDLQMEKEWQQLESMKNMLFVDQLALLFHKSSEERMEQKNMRTD
ncbi:SWI/SNF complex subunit SWI3B [Corylus avellana]|uniref:SWI/SNF complex subunit SWI3B n=1 Tax=Corylus avellana TaxID=13451 RepID=UPI00286AA5FB|nr:SWI/SNF complex subunit SWI3B [Corylus avellana]